MSKMLGLIGPELHMSTSLLLIPFQFHGPTLLSPRDFEHYFLKEISAEHRALTHYFCRRFFGSLGHARLTAIKSAFGLHRHEVESMCAKLGYERGIQGIILIFENDLMPFDGIFAQF